MISLRRKPSPAGIKAGAQVGVPPARSAGGRSDSGINTAAIERNGSAVIERSEPGIKSHWIAGLGGLLIGHILWLIAIKLAIAAPAINFWVLIVAAVIAVVAAICFFVGWRLYKREVYGWAIFLLALPVSPVLFTLAVLGVTYV